MVARRELLVFDFSGLTVAVRCAEEGLLHRISEGWHDYAETAVSIAPPWLVLDVELGARPLPVGPFAPKAMHSDLTGPAARFEMPEGTVIVDRTGTARIVLGRGLDPRRAYYTFLNLARAALAWRLPDRGGLLLHAAAIVDRGRALVLVGREGAGKSTWAALGEQAGAKVITDDLAVLDGVDGSIQLLGAPFRSSYAGPCIRGRWPLEVVLVPVRGDRARLDALSPLLARAAITANLPFLTDVLASDSRVTAAIEKIADEVVGRTLTFALDASFMPLLRSL